MTGNAPCRWFAACEGIAVALVRHPALAPVPTCQRCIDRQQLEQHIVARITPALATGEPLPRPVAQHVADHFFKGVCICPCGDCTERVGEGLIMCTCVDCPAEGCGAKAPTRAGAA